MGNGKVQSAQEIGTGVLMKLITIITILIYSISVNEILFVAPFALADTTVNGTQSIGFSDPKSVYPTQQAAQQNTQNKNNDGKNQSNAAGMAAIAAGAAMVAAGMATVPPNVGLIMAGIALIAAGMAALAAASKMGQNEDTAAGQNKDMSNISTPPVDPLNNGKNGDIKIDPSLLRDGPSDQAFAALENKTGMSREDFVKGLANGQSVGSLIANSPKKPMSEGQFNSMLDGATPMDQKEALDRMGLSDRFKNDENVMNIAGAGGSSTSRAPNSNQPSLDDLFGRKNTDDGKNVGDLKMPQTSVGKEVQAALDKNGISTRSLFAMVKLKNIKFLKLKIHLQI